MVEKHKVNRSGLFLFIIFICQGNRSVGHAEPKRPRDRRPYAPRGQRVHGEVAHGDAGDDESISH